MSLMSKAQGLKLNSRALRVATLFGRLQTLAISL